MTEIQYLPEIQEVISSGRVLNVLIVDDSKMIRTAIREILELGNIQVTEAANGKDALNAVHNNLPDLVLLDIVMPEMDGVSVLKSLRKLYSKLQLPIILVTAKGSTNDIVQALDYGANDYVTKPIDFDVLWARLSNQLMQKQAAEYMRSAQASLDNQIKKRTSTLNISNQQLKEEIEVRLQAEDELQKQANFDSLTGLPNRSLATDRLNQTLVKAKRNDLEPCVAFLDLDNFKHINDTYGHEAGDELLREVSRRLTDCARESDTVARLGGDEFLLILDDNKLKEEDHIVSIRHIGERIIDSFSKPFLLEGNEVNITPSLGFAIYPKDGADSKNLMRHADFAMYRSKHDGKNTYCFYSPDMTAKAKLRIGIEEQLKGALERNELSIHYQPIIDCKTGEITQAEACLQWNSKKLGVVSPESFIPIAEETGLIVPIGAWLINSACNQVKKWRDAGFTSIRVSVNIFERQLHSNSSLLETIDGALKLNQLSSDAIQLEITEDVLLKNSDDVEKTLIEIKKMGIKLLLDDYGSDYASITTLQRYNFDSIKIDSNVINGSLKLKANHQLVKAIVSMAHSLCLSVISNGVTNKNLYNSLFNVNCESLQGNYFSEAVIADKFSLLLKKMNNHHLNELNNLIPV